MFLNRFKRLRNRIREHFRNFQGQAKKPPARNDPELDLINTTPSPGTVARTISNTKYNSRINKADSPALTGSKPSGIGGGAGTSQSTLTNNDAQQSDDPSSTDPSRGRSQKRIYIPENPVTRVDSADADVLRAAGPMPQDTTPFPMLGRIPRRTSSQGSCAIVSDETLETDESTEKDEPSKKDRFSDQDKSPPRDGPSEKDESPQFRYLMDILKTPVICNRAHPLSTLQHTPRAHASVPQYCSGVTAQVQVSRDGVPFLFDDSRLTKRYNDPRKAEDLTWHELVKIHNCSGKHPEARIMRLSELLNGMTEDDHDHRVVFLEIKAKKKQPKTKIRYDAAGAVKRVLNGSSHSRRLVSRIVICVPSCKDLHHFMSVFRGHRILLKCKDLGPAKRAMKNRSLGVVHFKIDRRVLISWRGKRFLAKAKHEGREVYIEKVNKGNEMEWCIRRGISGIVTDHPRRLDGLYWDFTQNNRARTMPSIGLYPRLLLASANPQGGIRRIRQIGHQGQRPTMTDSLPVRNRQSSGLWHQLVELERDYDQRTSEQSSNSPTMEDFFTLRRLENFD
ncbi:hypothetical protein BDW59DRAFT_165594 [Aspergillus cavernicola]|uniref:GP-PDE domain-containing protein n=1 Tax=Aspergillus cavernicola TaxID=176166 RepID=A0ABR4HRP3_9EURO